MHMHKNTIRKYKHVDVTLYVVCTRNDSLEAKNTEHVVLMKTVEIEFLWADAQIAVHVEPDCQRQPVCHEKPLTNVELAAIH